MDSCNTENQCKRGDKKYVSDDNCVRKERRGRAVNRMHGTSPPLRGRVVGGGKAGAQFLKKKCFTTVKHYLEFSNRLYFVPVFRWNTHRRFLTLCNVLFPVSEVTYKSFTTKQAVNQTLFIEQRYINPSPTPPQSPCSSGHLVGLQSFLSVQPSRLLIYLPFKQNNA